MSRQLLSVLVIGLLVIGCADDIPNQIDAESLLGPALVSSAVEEGGALLLTFSGRVTQVTVDGVLAEVTDGGREARVRVGSGVLDVLWSGVGGGTFQDSVEVTVEVTAGDTEPDATDAETGPSFESEGIVFLPVATGGSVEIEGRSFDINPFYIAKHETTNAQYDAFVQATDGFGDATWWANMPVGESPPQQRLGAKSNDLADAPRDEVTWYQAVAFTRWLNARMAAKNSDISAGGLLVNGVAWRVRLPAEWEWQWAAQGGAERRAYPWGSWQEGHANTADAGVGATTEVGSYPLGAAACGALDMSGNAWEWCLNKHLSPYSVAIDTTNHFRSVRGGAYSDIEDAASSHRAYNDADGKWSDLGFRVGLFPPTP